jgi:ABC-type Mn2+/Zn2+ transport system ATPase subunit
MDTQAPPSQTAARLLKFSVSNLFGEFSHQIPLHTSSRITAIIAPNGTGKTACLRLINAFLRRQWSQIAQTQFDSIEFSFSNSVAVSVFRTVQKDTEKHSLPKLKLEIVSPASKKNWSPKIFSPEDMRIARIERYIPHFFTRIAANKWIHDVSGKPYDLQEIIENFPDSFPPSVLNLSNEGEPEELRKLLDDIDCHLIETQRLVVVQEEESRFERRGSSSILAISRKAQTLKNIISQNLTNYAALSQSLDRSFPRRVIQRQGLQVPVDLQDQLRTLDEKRKLLMETGILQSESEAPVVLPDGELDDAVARVLDVYAEDTWKKLASLDELLGRVRVFKRLIEERFAPKTVEIDKQNGFIIKNKGESIVPLEKLSSGEQHQLVLFFELLFELKSNALILIDEPELSLHVSWQKQFISDLKQIIELNKFDVVLATHSPSLIGRWPELIVEIGDIDEAEGI